MKALIWAVTAIMPGLAWAASSGAHGGDHHDIPWSLIIAQAANFGLLLVILVFLTRKTVGDAFQKRSEDFQKLMKQAMSAKDEAERQKQEIADRLRKLESTAEESVRRARVEAEELRQKIVQDARSQSHKMEQEALRTIQFEADKSRNELRQELLRKAMDLAGRTLQEKVGAQDQKRLQTEFVEKIQVVQ